MLRSHNSLSRLVRLCVQQVQAPSFHATLKSPAARLVTPALRWFSSAQPNSAPAVVEITDDAAVKERKLKILQMEASVLRQEGRRVPDPDQMKPDQWEHLLSLNSKSARSKYYTFLWSVQMKRDGEKVGQENIFK